MECLFDVRDRMGCLATVVAVVHFDFADCLGDLENAFAIAYAVNSDRDQRLIHAVSGAVGTSANLCLNRYQRRINTFLRHSKRILDQPTGEQAVGCGECLARFTCGPLLPFG